MKRFLIDKWNFTKTHKKRDLCQRTLQTPISGKNEADQHESKTWIDIFALAQLINFHLLMYVTSDNYVVNNLMYVMTDNLALKRSKTFVNFLSVVESINYLLANKLCLFWEPWLINLSTLSTSWQFLSFINFNRLRIFFFCFLLLSGKE